MKKLLFFFVFALSFAAHGQLYSLTLRNDTLFSINPGTGAETQLTKLVPSPSGQSGKVLSSNGTNYSWITPTVYLSSNGDGSALTGLTKSQVGLGNVDNTSDATKNSASAVLSSKTLATFNYAADAGSNDSYVISLSPAPASYTAGMIVFFKANTVNTGAASINVNSLGVKTIVKRVNTTLANGDIPALALCMLIYDGTNFVLLNPVVN